MNEKSLSGKVISGMKWKAFERLFLQLVNAATPMVLARLLMPADFGVVAILSVFITIAKTFVNNGIANSIIQKKDSDLVDSSTVFYTQLTISVICYIILFFIAPKISSYYNNSELTLMLRVMSLSLIIGSFGSMQTTTMKKNMDFSKSFIINGISTIVYGVVGIGMAYSGFGVWSLVFANLANSFSLTITSTILIRWKPSFTFSFNRLKSLFSYSWKLSVGWIVGTIHQDVYTIVIGTYFNQATLGYYNRAGSFPHIITKTVTEVVDGVMFPALSKIQDNKEKLKEVTRNLLSVNSFVLFPVFLGLAAVSENLVLLVLTEKWLPAAPMMQIMCITYALNSLNNSNMQVFNSMGRSDIFMKFELIKRTFSLLLLMIFAWMSSFISWINIYFVISILLLMAIASNLMNSYQNSKLLGYKFKQIIADVLPSFIMAIIMALVVWYVGHINLFLIATLIIQVACGMVVYGLLAVIFRPKAAKLLITIAKEKLLSKKSK